MENATKYGPVPGKIPGTVINLGGRELTLAPLSLDGVQEFEPLRDELSKAENFQAIAGVIARMLALSLQRNYPDMTVEDVLGLLDTQNAQSSMLELAKVSGLALVPGEPRPASR